jgi:molybdopterin-guanine dinucleotide biosynthesis protein B
MRVFGIVGRSGAGKTHLVVRLVRLATARGLRVATIKHAHHAFDVDQPGKDSYEHRAAGAQEVLVASSQRWALMHELRGAPEPTLQDLLARLSPCDLVLVEGYKREVTERLEVWRTCCAEPPLAAADEGIRAVATDSPDAVAVAGIVTLPLADASAVLNYVLVRR